MRPTVEEQLAQTCRLLEEVVAPELTTEYAGRVLTGLVKNLRMLERKWDAVLPFLLWDNERTSELLSEAGPAVPQTLAHRIAQSFEMPMDPSNFSDAQARSNVLRALLSEVVVAFDTESETGAQLQRKIIDHMKIRTARYPMRMVPELAQSEA